jgi:hypothetical protein
MNHYTYMITVKNPTDARRLYLGVRSCKVIPEEDLYFGSCKPFRAWQKQHGTGCLEKQVLAVWPTREEALSHEILLHDYFDVAANPEFWNQAKQTAEKFHTFKFQPWNKGIPSSEETKQKLREISKGNTNRRGKTHTEEAKLKNSLAHIGKAYHTVPHSEESKAKMSAAKRGKRLSPATEFKKGQTAHNKGQTWSEEVRLKVSESLKKYNARRKLNVSN